jgi:hypothetical protein
MITRPTAGDSVRSTCALEHSLVIFGTPFGIYSGPVLDNYIQKAFTNWTYLVSGINFVWSVPKNGPDHACFIPGNNFMDHGRPHVLHVFINHNP